jgi:Spy/CpxP family protein refolding chaperone
MKQDHRAYQKNLGIILAPALLVLALAGHSFGQALVPSDREELLKGHGMGMASYAEENGYPGPKHTLELKDQLGLIQDQLKKTEALEKVVTSSAVAKGQEIIQAEEELNKLIEAGTMNEKLLRSKLEQVAMLRADLRFIHLQAHLRMKQILTADQIQRYKELRGNEGKREN